MNSDDFVKGKGPTLDSPDQHERSFRRARVRKSCELRPMHSTQSDVDSDLRVSQRSNSDQRIPAQVEFDAARLQTKHHDLWRVRQRNACPRRNHEATDCLKLILDSIIRFVPMSARIAITDELITAASIE